MFCYTDSTIPLLPISKISSFEPSSVIEQASLCQTLSETPKIVFLILQLNLPLVLELSDLELQCFTFSLHFLSVWHTSSTLTLRLVIVGN